jgi:hypothetical protein
MKRKSQWIGIAALMALAMFMFSACPMDDNTEDDGTVTSVTVIPKIATVAKGTTEQFTAAVAVTGGAAQTVKWTVTGKSSEGTNISAQGILTIAAAETATTLTVTATSTVDTTKFDTATVTVSQAGGQGQVTSVTVSPKTATVTVGTTEQFTAAVVVTGGAAQTVTWTVTGTGKHNDTAISTQGVLTIAAAETATSLTVTATATADATKSDTATVTVSKAGGDGTVTSVTVSPKTATVTVGTTEQFAAAVVVTGSAAQTVNWKVEGTGKHADTAISAQGVLTIAAAETATSLTVTATATADATKSDTATVTVRAAGEETGKLAITIGFDGDITVTGTPAIPAAGIVISKSGATKTIVLTASADYTGPVWYVDGSVTGTSAASITLNAADYAATKHSVSFTGTKGGTLYSREIPFSVVE